ncbi:DUF2637 domain-containing protein [Streptomyces sp. NBC_00053]|uniref:DUF2637 domain-containing protein n=1 Tax=unclassified Streptomyces TaxID=2593676 RepID=UPI002251D52B|nr:MULTISPECIES: DUF2637 domain-containing protein [unclassified Streptomyces]MCX5501092.1 DUF2637 domain-containing protein [Streptomyces sp. NBC_00052]MCX5550373.1 DUF2637 domain-containing protein [Streptomyces sp. NBC_00051]WSP48477.1 DUF2637 domain-containing protein [Streptomyces sp. NBC_01243]
MPSPTLAAAPSAAPVPLAAAIRAGVALLAVAAFALSYDALRQMAAASHIHPALTYAFPLVIDGFIAIGIGALLVLRTAPLSARLYVSALVGIATATSIWANVLHAIRLNQQARHNGLSLDDITVGVISAIAPLALAGAVHFYLLVARRPATPDRHNTDDRREPAEGHKTSELAPPPATDTNDVPQPLAKRAAETPQQPGKPGSKQPSVSLEQAVAIGRTAPLGRAGRASRRNIEKAVRDKGFGISRSRLDEVKDLLQAELDAATTSTG